MNVVVSQSMYFPWVGLLEQISLADIFIHYDDVQYAKGFCNRVQVKTAQGVRWLSVPLVGRGYNQIIDQIVIDNSDDWSRRQRETLRHAYSKTEYFEEMIELFDKNISHNFSLLSDLSRNSIILLAKYFNLYDKCKFVNSRELGVGGSSSQRLFDLVKSVGGDTYITGHGARNYLDHQLFENFGIEVRYMNYQCLGYNQLHGDFTPYVSALDLITNCGKDGRKVICSETRHWKEFVNGKA